MKRWKLTIVYLIYCFSCDIMVFIVRRAFFPTNPNDRYMKGFFSHLTWHCQFVCMMHRWEKSTDHNNIQFAVTARYDRLLTPGEWCVLTAPRCSYGLQGSAGQLLVGSWIRGFSLAAILSKPAGERGPWENTQWNIDTLHRVRFSHLKWCARTLGMRLINFL